jgi:hypothetical protein
MATKLRVAGPTLAKFDTRAVTPGPKVAASHTQSAAYREWAEKVIAHAGGQCEAVDLGERCTKARPLHRMFADHKIEVRDGGALYDPLNGRCLCGAHHSRKTARARADRRFA